MPTSSTEFGSAFGAAVPFVAHLGLEVEADTDRQTVRLPDTPELANHVGTRHAGALFTAAETASGATVVALLTRRRLEAVPLLAEVSIRYKAPAVGIISAVPHLSAPQDFEQLLVERGRADVAVTVDITSGEDQVVAVGSFRWVVLRSAKGAA